MKYDAIDFREFEIECLTPVYVGSGETLKAFQYIYNSREQDVIFIDEHKWISFLAKHKLMDDFAQYVQTTARKVSSRYKNNYSNTSLWQWLINHRIPIGEINDLAIRHSYARNNVIEPGGGKALNDVSCCMSDPAGKPYIPGSTIKGFLHTAIMFSLLQKNPQLKTKYWSMIENDRSLKNASKPKYNTFPPQKATLQLLINDLLRKIKLVDKDGKPAGNDSTESIMRGLQVSDAFCKEEIQTEVLRKIDVNSEKNMNGTRYKVGEHTLSLYRECIPSETKLTFTISVDKRIMGLAGINTVDDVLKCAREFILFCNNLQRDIFKSEYNDVLTTIDTADLWIGGGNGFLTKTLVYALAPDRNSAKQKIAYFLDDVFFDKRKQQPSHFHQKTDKLLAPRALKISYEGHTANVLGLCSIKEIQRVIVED